MSVQPVPSAPAAAAPARRSLLRLYGKETRYELLKMIRMPAYALPTLAFPIVFYTFFGLSFAGSKGIGSVSMPAYLLATYGTFGVIGTSMFAFGVGVAVERGQGWMLLKRASPMPPSAYFAAKVVLSFLFGTVIVLSLSTLAATVGGVSMPASRWALLFVTLVAGALPFCAFGLALGYLVGPNSAPAVVNLIYLPMAFLSGLWVPLPMLPKVVREIAAWLPAYHTSQLALKVIGADTGAPLFSHLAYLAAFTFLALLAARFGYRRDEGIAYG